MRDCSSSVDSQSIATRTPVIDENSSTIIIKTFQDGSNSGRACNCETITLQYHGSTSLGRCPNAEAAPRTGTRRRSWRVEDQGTPVSKLRESTTLPAGRECGVSGAICTKGDDRRQLTNSPSATVTGPVGISVADARVEEGDGAVLAFLVTLSRAAGGTVAVDYATANGSAHAGVDYRSRPRPSRAAPSS